ncbi:ATPase [Hymenobacter fastidiosus]|uniref:ATPase n=1 Tax=Hymenobacter fastidiosus TaxID=486264 RepID=A0ABP7T122_9BACT
MLAQLDAFKRKFYLNLLIRGGLVAGGLLLTLFVVLNLLEYFLYLPTWVRGGLLFGFLGLVAYTFLHWIWQPLAALTNLRRLLTDEQAAARVGELFPQVQDKLLNALQLQGQARENALVAASLEQRAGQLTGLEFARGINIKAQTRPLWKYLAVPAGVMVLLLLVWPSLFVQGTDRILHYRNAYAPPAPFRFVLKNKDLRAFKNEDFKLEVAIEGDALPNEISIRYGGRERRLTRAAANTYTYAFRQLQRDVEFRLSGAGFTSDDYDLTVRERPNLRDFTVLVTYPAYLSKPAETIRNSGNLTVPEGSNVRWEFTTAATDQLQLLFQNPTETVTATAADDQFQVTRRVLRSQEYAVRLRNAASLNRDPIQYQITAVPDQVPEVTVESFADTTSLRYLALGGNVRDDYGLSRLQLHYRVTSKARPNADYKVRALALQSGPSQSYTYQWNLAPLGMKPGDRLEYFVQVWDNDGVHGPKSARTRAAEFRLPSKTELRQQLASQSASVQSQLSKSQEQSKKMERELAKASDKLKTKRELNFQDRKQLQDMLEQKQQMDEQIADMKKLFEELNQQQDQLDPKSQELAEKTRELQKLMDSLLDPETKKLYDQLQKLLQEQKTPDVDLQKLMQQLENKENTLQKELERALEMFKQLQFEQKQEQATEKLEQLAQEQEKLAEQTAKNDRNNPDNKATNEQQKAKNEQLKDQQAEKKQQFEDLKKDLSDLKKLDEQLGNENGADEMKPEQEQVDEQQQESEEQLGKNQNQKASQSQQKAAQQMKQMAQKMRQQQKEEESDQKQENIDDLRDILENLLKLSFDEEGLMKQFRQVDQADPRFVQLGQTQRKLRDDAAIIQDSLYALARRVSQLESFVTREVGEMNGRMDEALDQIRQRNVARATGSQQLAMTSMNNLALMLNDALQQMQQEQREGQQAQQQGGGKPGRKKKKGSAAGDGQMGRMQQQLNQQIQQLQQSGKTGRAMSEDLAKLAAQQQMLREALRELDKLQQKGKKGSKDGKGQDGGGGTGDVKKLMEQTETDLVNKRLTEQTVLRQRQILTRLLEVEKSARERDQDEKREAQTAQPRPPVFPPAFDKYKQQKNRQTELLRTVPPALTPYYQREVSEYFQKMK